ncbi:hypothetical protein ACET3Z_020716 [Daucus carota]
MQIQNLECEIQEKTKQMRLLEQRITESSESSVANASLADMQQTLMRLMTQCNEKGFDLEIGSVPQYLEDTRDTVLVKAEKLEKGGWEAYLNS